MGLINDLLELRRDRLLDFEREAARQLREEVKRLTLEKIRIMRELEIALRENAALRREQGQ